MQRQEGLLDRPSRWVYFFPRSVKIACVSFFFHFRGGGLVGNYFDLNRLRTFPSSSSRMCICAHQNLLFLFFLNCFHHLNSRCFYTYMIHVSSSGFRCRARQIEGCWDRWGDHFLYQRHASHGRVGWGTRYCGHEHYVHGWPELRHGWKFGRRINAPWTVLQARLGKNQAFRHVHRRWSHQDIPHRGKSDWSSRRWFPRSLLHR